MIIVESAIYWALQFAMSWPECLWYMNSFKKICLFLWKREIFFFIHCITPLDGRKRREASAGRLKALPSGSPTWCHHLLPLSCIGRRLDWKRRSDHYNEASGTLVWDANILRSDLTSIAALHTSLLTHLSSYVIGATELQSWRCLFRKHNGTWLLETEWRNLAKCPRACPA